MECFGQTICTMSRWKVKHYTVEEYMHFIFFISYKMRQVGILKVAKQSIRTMRLRAGAEEFEKSIAALTIQLAWRKYYR